MNRNDQQQPSRTKHKTKLALLLVALPLAFLLKDVIATIAILATEPGITARAATYYRVALLPGTLFLSAGGAMLFNPFAGFVIACFLYRRAVRWLNMPPNNGLQRTRR